jgi:hypothetical protein
MSRRYVCEICGRTVATFSSWRDVDPSDILGLLEEELRDHNVNTSDLEEAQVLSRFKVVDEGESEGPPAADDSDAGTWTGQ